MKVQFADADGKPVDGRDVLLLNHRTPASEFYQSFKITDDLPIMGTINDGKPCWILDEGLGESIPIFSRYIPAGDEIYLSLDFSVPRQFDIPGMDFIEGKDIYARGWKDYLTDRYDVNTKVMRCRVDFGGMQVNHQLLRKFYYYDGSLWVLNKITNHSLTTYDPVECEFIKVQNKTNYRNGQNFIF